MRYEILGDLRVVRDDQPVVDLGPPKQRALLALLVLSAGRPVPAEQLVDQLWAGRPPRTAGHSVQVYVSDLRARLRTDSGEPIATTPGGYLLRAEPDQVDAQAFELLLAEGRAALADGRAQPAAGACSRALALWRGPALGEFAGEEFAQAPIAALEQLRLDGLEALAEALLAVGDAPRALRVAQDAAAAGPLRERPRELLMQALYRLGRHADALRAYGRFADLLGDELGVDPSPELRRLYERVLLHDPELLPPAAVRPAHGARNPYKGLLPFTREDAGDFFGREDLVGRVLDELRLGVRLVTFVGPSGSGKSSALAAGVLPRLPELGRTSRPLAVTPDEQGAALLETGVPAGTVLVVDQLEELFLRPDPSLPQRFLRALAGALHVPGVCALATLRADFYDRPLQHADVAETFLAGIVTVLPLSAADLEQVVLRPAARVGVRLEEGLAAELVADAVDRPGALPLLEYALTELFERGMTLSAYREMGRLSGALHRRAEQLFEQLTASEREVAMLLLLRLVRVVPEGRHSRRRVEIAELTDGADPVELSRVLHVFAGHRLLSLDRDPATGGGTVELAHESLLWEWDRYAGWVERHRSALADRDALLQAVQEWESSGRHTDYLLRGRRLERFTGVGSDALLVTRRERALLDASLAARETEQHEALRQRRRRRRGAVLGGGLAVVLAAAAAGTAALLARGDDPTRVGLLFHDAGTEVDQRARLGFDRGIAEFDVVGQVHAADPVDAEDLLADLSGRGTDAVLVLTVQTDVEPVAREHPDVHYVVVDQVLDLPNVTAVVSRDEEGAYLAGAAAAMTTRTGTVGFVGGVEGELIGRFEAGFVAGARATRPDVRVLVDYLSVPPDLEGFVDPEGGERLAREMYLAGADVVFAAAGQSGLGAFEAAADLLEEDGRQRWAIGVDEDQFESVRSLNGVVDPSRWQRHILTSVTKALDRTVHDIVRDLEDGEMAAGRREVGLRDGAVGLSWSGGHLDDRRAELEEIRDRIVSGELRVPSVPTPS